jgi:ribose transport system permease protein
LILIIFLAIVSPQFFSVSNFSNIARQSSAMGILAIGQTLVIIMAGIDLSVGSIMALSGCLIAVSSTQWGVSPFLAILLGVAGGVAVGMMNGAIITKAKIQDFIATLGALTTIAGLALLVTNGLPISGIPKAVLSLGSGRIAGVPVELIVFLLVAFMGWIILNYTTLGRDTLAIGGNMEAARVSGIKVDFTKIIVYSFSGFCAAIASIVMIGRLNSANALMGGGMELLAIAAVVLGGTSLAGGAGGIGGTIIGVFTMGILSNGLDLLNISAFWQKVILGLVIIGVVTLDTWRRRRVQKNG